MRALFRLSNSVREAGLLLGSRPHGPGHVVHCLLCAMRPSSSMQHFGCQGRKAVPPSFQCTDWR